MTNKGTTTKQVEQQPHRREYGLLSMIAMIIGIVIGSGIFVKNQSLIETSNSIAISMSVWIVGSLIVFAIVVAFMEIFTRVEDENEQMTSANLGKVVMGEKFGKWIGFYFAYVNIPSTIAVFSLFAAGQIMSIFDQQHLLVWVDETSRIMLTLGMFAFFFIMNGIYTTPGKIFQNIGTMIKLVPLAIVIFLLGGVIIAGWVDPTMGLESLADKQEILTQNAIESANVTGSTITDVSAIMLFAMSMPAIMFAYDGFIISGSLSKQGKKKSTYRDALFIGIAFTMVLYMIFSLSVFMLGEVEHIQYIGGSLEYTDGAGNILSADEINPYQYGSIQNVIYSVFDGAAAWITPAISLTIVVSMLTATSGCVIGTINGMADLSANNLITDKDGKLLKRNKAYALPGSAQFTLYVALAYLLLVVGLDVIAVPTSAWGMTVTEAYKMDSFVGVDYGTGYFSSLASLGAFSMFTLVLVGAMATRNSNPPKVRNKSFVPAAMFAIIFMGFTLIVYAMQLFVHTGHVRLTIVNFLSVALMIGLTVFTYYFTEWRLSKFNEVERKAKQPLIDEYKNN